MTERKTSRSSLSALPLRGRILLLILCICGIAMNRSARTQHAAVPGSGPTQCDSGMSRHSMHAAALPAATLQAAAMVVTGDPAATASPGSSQGAPPGMVWIPGGRFWMGTDHMEDAQPVHQVEVKGFWIDRTDVTNEEFARFVKATGYVTIAERPLDPKEFPNLAPEDLAPGSVVFTAPSGPVSLDNPLAWWR